MIEVTANTNLTAALLQQLAIPRGVTRLLFKTVNSRRCASKIIVFCLYFLSHTSNPTLQLGI